MKSRRSSRAFMFTISGIALFVLGGAAFGLAQIEFNTYHPSGPAGVDYSSWHSGNVRQRGVGAGAALVGMVAVVAGMAARLPNDAGGERDDSRRGRWTVWTKRRLIGTVALYAISIAGGYVIASLGFLIGGRLEDSQLNSSAQEVVGAIVFAGGVALALVAPAFVAYTRRTPVALAVGCVAGSIGLVYAGVVLAKWPPTIDLFTF